MSPAHRLPARLCLLLTLCAAPTARAADTWTTPEPGLRHLHRTATGPLSMDAVFVDLCDPGVDFRATLSAERQQTPSAWGRAVGARAVINADFFNYTGYQPIGLAVGNGEVWSGTSDGSGWALFAAGRHGRVSIRDASEALGTTPEAWMQQVVGGSPNCLVAGVPQYDTASHYAQRHPRSAVGISRDGETLILLVVDGRSTASIGVTTQQLGQILLDLGAWDGLNFDGGGSSALWLATEGVVNEPSDGSQRVVANHLGVMRTATPANEPSRCCHPAAVANSSGTFEDVSDAYWAKEAIEEVYVNGITNGCSQSPRYFCPECRTTRAAAVAMLVRSTGWSLVRPATASFADVPTNHSLFAEIETAVAHGVTSGCGGGNFCPNDPASRATVAIFAARTFGLSTAAPAAAPFADVPANHAAAGAIKSLVDACIVGGCGDGNFCPTRTARRSEMAIIVARGAGLVETGCETEPPDAGMPFDAGAPFDAGSTVVDAGSTVIDAGSTVVDAGSTVVDAGTIVVDAGSTISDAGSVPGDAGSIIRDAGSTTSDAGGTTVDASTPEGDGGQLSDAGATGIAPAGVEGGCACGSSGGTSGVLLFAFGALALLRRPGARRPRAG
jgi:hypothetical protein